MGKAKGQDSNYKYTGMFKGNSKATKSMKAPYKGSKKGC